MSVNILINEHDNFIVLNQYNIRLVISENDTKKK